MEKGEKKLDYYTRKIIKETSQMNDLFEIVDYFRNDAVLRVISDREIIDEIKQKLKDRGARNIVIDALEETQIEESNANRIINEIGLKNAIEAGAVSLEQIPEHMKDELFKLAMEYEENGNFTQARDIYATIIKMGIDRRIEKFIERYENDETIDEDEIKSLKEKRRTNTLYYKSVFQYFNCKLSNNEQLTDEDKRLLDELLEKDKAIIDELILRRRNRS